jgi:cytoskeletal protein CcmA (bactofilin family)
MFSSKSKDNVPASGLVQSQAKRGGRSAGPSIISSDLVVHGTLTSAGDIQIDGRVEGDVHSAGLVIGEKAHVQGEVVAEDVVVRGTIEGSIRARKVMLASTCHVEGNILHEAFSVEQGAFFEGNCRHSSNPAASEASNSDSLDEHAPISLNSVDHGASRPAMEMPSMASFSPLKNGA